MARIIAAIVLLAATLLAAAPSAAQGSCLPGSEVILAGTGPAGALLVARFNQRPVGGGRAGSDGAYRIVLTVGRERPGQHVMTVELRETRDVIQRITCEIPGATGQAPQPSPTPRSAACDPAYPEVCIKPGPPDLDCPDVLPLTDFKVLEPDPHRFDADNDGIGCEAREG